MLDLPEIEILRRDLERDIAGRKVKTVESKGMSCLSRYKTRNAFAAQLEGLKIASVSRRGMGVLFELEDESVMVLTFGPEGRIRRNSNKDETEKHTQVVIGFTQGGQMRLIDKGGESDLAIVPAEELDETFPELLDLGLDPIETPVSWTEFANLLNSTKTKLKTLITDQKNVVGIGNMYADEILFQAGLRYDRLSNTLSTQEIRRFYRALVETLHDSIKYRGTSLDSRPYLDVFGEEGDYQSHLQVYEKHGDLSPRSRTPILRSKFGGSWTYYCETQV